MRILSMQQFPANLFKDYRPVPGKLKNPSLRIYCKKLNCLEQYKILTNVFLQTLFTYGLALFFKSIREDWLLGFRGKKYIAVKITAKQTVVNKTLSKTNFKKAIISAKPANSKITPKPKTIEEKPKTIEAKKRLSPFNIKEQIGRFASLPPQNNYSKNIQAIEKWNDLAEMVICWLDSILSINDLTSLVEINEISSGLAAIDGYNQKALRLIEEISTFLTEEKKVEKEAFAPILITFVSHLEVINSSISLVETKIASIHQTLGLLKK